MRRPILAGLLAAFLAGPLLGQALSTEEFDARRQALRTRYAAAISAKEKQAILDEFARLDLALGAAAAAAPGAGGVLVRGLLAGLDASRNGAGPGSGASGLGSRADDARIHELEIYVAASERELSPVSTPDWAVLPSSTHVVEGGSLWKSAEVFLREWLVLRESLELAFLEDARAELAALRRGERPSGDFEAARMEHWSELLEDTGRLRRLVARDVQTHFRLEIARREASLRSHRRELDALQASAAKVAGAIEDRDRARRLTKLVLDLKDVADVLGDSADAVSDLGHLGKLVLGRLEDQVADTDDLIVDAVARLGESMVHFELVLEGFSSVEDLARRLRTALEEASRTNQLLAEDLRRHEAAVRVEGQPIWLP